MRVSSLALALAVFSLPVIEIALIHSLVREALGQNNVVLGFYARDIYLPVLIGMFISFLLIHERRPFRFQVQPRTLAANLLMLAALAALLSHFDAAVAFAGAAGVTFSLIAGVFALLLSSLVCFVCLAEVSRSLQAFGFRLVYVLAALSSLILYRYILEAVWPTLVLITAKCVYWTLKALGFAITRFDIAHSIRISHPNLAVSIGMGCSGLEGVFFFLFAYSLYLLFLEKPWPLRRQALACAGGVVLLFAINTFRIVLFFAVAIAINQNLESKQGRAFFVWAFHENVGWLLYLFGIAAYLYFLGRFSATSGRREASLHPS